jgi:hypothetical protein
MKMISIKTLILGGFFLFVTEVVSAQPSEPEKSIYSQHVNRFHSFLESFKGSRGVISLEDSKIVYTARNKKGRDSFVLDYKDILSVRNRFLIVITDKNYSKFKLGTYKRREMLEIIQSKIGTSE